ncbi:MAG: NCS2 family permease [Christensenellaceae bacterium]|nr:NCS2 family permease [Christensenellaceae bacterium]
MKQALDNFFMINERKSNFKTEIIAGTTTFATMAYILIVQAMIMSSAGMNATGVMLSTALMSGVITLLMGLWAKLPFALAPAMGTNAIFAGLVASGGATFQQGLGMIIISGVVFLLLSIFKIREDMVAAMPKNLKVGVGAAIGMFLARLGLDINAQIVKSDMSGFNDFSNPAVRLGLYGLIICIVLSFIRVKINGRIYKVRGAMLISIILTTILGIFMGIVQLPQTIFTGSLQPMGEVVFKADIIGALQVKYIPYMIIFFIGDFFSTLGTALGLGAKAGMLDSNGNLPGIGNVFLVDAIGTVTGGIMGLTTITTYVESAAGVEAGGKTGFASVITSIFFFISMLFAPLFIMIPGGATGPALIMIGISMMEVLKDVNFDAADWAPVAIMVLVTAYANDFAAGIAIGTITCTIIGVLQYAFTGEKEKIPHWSTFLLSALMALKFVF